jgi:hypothetical protein
VISATWSATSNRTRDIGTSVDQPETVHLHRKANAPQAALAQHRHQPDVPLFSVG